MSHSTLTPKTLLGGAQDNGTFLYRNGNWSLQNQGDGYKNTFDKVNDEISYSTKQYKDVWNNLTGGQKLDNSISSSPEIPILDIDGNTINRLRETGGIRNFPMAAIPNVEGGLLVGYENIWKTTTGGTSWRKINITKLTQNLTHLEIAKTNNNLLFAANATNLFRSMDQGVNWDSLTIPAGINITDLSLKPDNANTLFIADSLLSKVYISIDMGNTWTQLLQPIPPETEILTIAAQDGPDNGIFIGYQTGIWYTNQSLPKWVNVNGFVPETAYGYNLWSALPMPLAKVRITDLQFDETNKILYAATFGKGIWMTNLNNYFKEDCVTINPDNVTISNRNNRFTIVDGTHLLFNAPNRSEAEKIIKIIKQYKITNSCFIGRPHVSFEYLLSKQEKAPVGAALGEECIAFTLSHLIIEKKNDLWVILDRADTLFSFDKEEEARYTLAIIKKYGFTKSCFVGRPNAFLKYMRK